VTRTQLLAMGVAAGTVDGWVADGIPIPAHAGVYAVGYRRVEPVARAAAAVLAGRCAEPRVRSGALGPSALVRSA
jgi:hypothetical protein